MAPHPLVAGDYREAAHGITGPSGFYRGIEGQQVGLVCNIVTGGDDATDLFAGMHYRVQGEPGHSFSQTCFLL
jgi:hypothetical protein